MAKKNKLEKPLIVFTMYGPYNVVGLDNITNSMGEKILLKPVASLCRCGASDSKPFCDGAHSKVEFVGSKEEDRVPDRTKEYEGNNISIIDNRGVCSHDKTCVNDRPAVFNRDRKPWIHPDGVSPGEIIDTVEKCPSGALSYKIGSKRYQELQREPGIKIAENGPLQITGGIEIKDDMESEPECREHYTLCRCGKSKNKPFCDGDHLYNGFKDDKN